MRTVLPVLLFALAAGCSGEAPAPPAPAPAPLSAPSAAATPAPPSTVAHVHAHGHAAVSASLPGAAAGDPVEGRRIATRVGCFGCHGADGAGKELWGEKGRFQIRSANITEHAAHYDDAAFERLLRTGATHSGQRALGMPVLMFQHLSDREVRDLTAFVRTLTPVANPGLKRSWFTPAERRKQEAYGDDLGDPVKAGAPAEPPTETLALGKYLALTSCTECHGGDLNGVPGDDAPSLIVAKAYSAADFETLMRRGLTSGGKESKTGLMSEVARGRFGPTLSDRELQALKAYLDAR